MKKSVVTLIAVSLFTTLISTAVQAAEKKSPGTQNAPAMAAVAQSGSRAGVMPFHGKLSAVDTTAKTITLQGKEKDRTFQVTSETRIIKQGKPATLEDAKVGDEVGGQAVKNGDKAELRTLRIGPKVEGEDKKEKKQ